MYLSKEEMIAFIEGIETPYFEVIEEIQIPGGETFALPTIRRDLGQDFKKEYSNVRKRVITIQCND